jgi:NADPH:quinone reductase-like Zn-dependent oxidoreductase
MRAFAVKSSGEPASVQDLPVPAADESVLVRVSFAGVNPLDNNLLGRLDADSAYPFVVGIDFAGVAERVPGGDHGLRVGDRVFGMARTHGSYAEVIRPGGRLVSTIFAADEGWFAQRHITAHNHSSRANPLISPQGLTTVGQMLADGAITARIGSTVDLDAAGRVLDELRQGGLHGKAVIRL